MDGVVELSNGDATGFSLIVPSTTDDETSQHMSSSSDNYILQNVTINVDGSLSSVEGSVSGVYLSIQQADVTVENLEANFKGCTFILID